VRTDLVLTLAQSKRLIAKGVARYEPVRRALAEMGPGDIFVKGANALNYGLGVAGVLIGHPTGGTVGAALGTIIARRIHLLVPVGLEKEVGWEITDASQRLVEEEGSGPSLWPLQGDIFTEIEALEWLFGVQAVPIAAGGVAGAEGAVWLACFGTPEQVEKVQALAEELAAEPPLATIS